LKPLGDVLVERKHQRGRRDESASEESILLREEGCLMLCVRRIARTTGRLRKRTLLCGADYDAKREERPVQTESRLFLSSMAHR
jgi:hypothetical protein